MKKWNELLKKKGKKKDERQLNAQAEKTGKKAREKLKKQRVTRGEKIPILPLPPPHKKIKLEEKIFDLRFVLPFFEFLKNNLDT